MKYGIGKKRSVLTQFQKETAGGLTWRNMEMVANLKICEFFPPLSGEEEDYSSLQ